MARALLWIGLATLPVLWVIGRQRIKSRRLDVLKVIVQALLGLSVSSAGWVLYIFLLALLSRFTGTMVDTVRERIANHVPVLLGLAVLAGLGGCALSFLLRPPARSRASRETSGATGGL